MLECSLIQSEYHFIHPHKSSLIHPIKSPIIQNISSPQAGSVTVAVHPGTCRADGQSPSRGRQHRRDHQLACPAAPPWRTPAVPGTSCSVCHGSTGRTSHQSVDESWRWGVHVGVWLGRCVVGVWGGVGVCRCGEVGVLLQLGQPLYTG